MNGLLALTTRRESLVRDAATNGLVTLLCLSVVASALQYAVDLPMRFTPTVVGTFGLVLVLLLAVLPRHHPHSRFGAANTVTLARTAMAALLLGCVGAGAQPVLAWVVASIATLAAGLILILSLLAWQFGKAGPWVLAAGLMRYAFVLAGLWLPWLRAALPPSVRRQTGCVVQVVALIGCLVPLVPPPWSAGLAAFGLVVLTASFTVDITWLVREARRAR